MSCRLTPADALVDHTQSEAKSGVYMTYVVIMSSMTMLLIGLLSYSAPGPY